ncbi:hypothetical protein LTR78_003322 [Recurvomyces mirabilis]|uniref:Uncharacterized protein n=1 Tax=Recurvomyces mirabilis TaxID=574656 RepID=A0AAE1C3U3_9PEZI|nr:hypothetical protein LTR78_003322 [Recurvomyces mirabilis]KAK5156860.1 hypothetical protein LTS14_004377 [Recurvomyces mirabilis]
MPGMNDEPVHKAKTQLQLPFPMCIGGQCSRFITVGSDGYIYLDAVRGEVKMKAFSGQGRGLYLYAMKRNGIFFGISGVVGSRELVLAWYAGTLAFEHEQAHFTATYHENEPGRIRYKYYRVDQTGSGPEAQATLQYPNHYIVPWSRGNTFEAGMEIDIATGDGLKPPDVRLTRHDVETCS